VEWDAAKTAIGCMHECGRYCACFSAFLRSLSILYLSGMSQFFDITLLYLWILIISLLFLRLVI
jgi:hypothetical protein